MSQVSRPKLRWICVPLVVFLVCSLTSSPAAAKKDKKKKKDPETQTDPYAEVVFPPPPNEPRIKLERILEGRIDIESKGSKWKRALIGASPKSEYDELRTPQGVGFDSEGRILVADSGIRAVVRFDLEGEIYDVFGTRTAPALVGPMSVGVDKDGTILVADKSLKLAVAFDSEGNIQSLYGKGFMLNNPTDAEFSPDGKQVFVVDSRKHQIFVFDRGDGDLIDTIGENGSGEGQFSFPTSLAFGPEGEIFVVDQINSRVQVFTPDGEFLDQFGALGTGFGSFVRPKDIAVDEAGFIYVTDAAFNNFQLFDIDFTLLTFVGTGGSGPGQFQGLSGIDVQGEWIAMADTLNRRIQVLRFIAPKTAE